MFYQTYTARKPPKSPPGRDGMVPSAADARCLQQAHTTRALPGVTWALSEFFLSLVTLTFDFWHWHSKSSERGTKHIYPVNFVQIRWEIPEIFKAQTKKQTNQKSHRLR